MERFRHAARNLVSYAILVTAAIISILPLLWAFSSSLRPPAETFSYTTPLTLQAFLPTRFDTSAYVYIFAEDGFGRSVLNSVVVGLAIVVGGLLINSMAAFAFARFEFVGKRVLFAIVLSTFMVSFEVIVVPLFLVVRQLGWIDSYAALVVPGLADAFAIFLLRQAFLEVPRELIEAARVDGASWMRIYGTIALPLVKPTMITAGLFLFIGNWDSFFWPLIATRSRELSVVQLGVNRYITNAFVQWDRVFAASIVASGVVLVLFLLLQRFYVRGISLTGMK